jgi:chaperonin GroEL (HSP60 family)
MEEGKFNHINLAIDFCDLVRTTLGPRGMNKMVVSEKDSSHLILTNDGATIVKNLKGGNPVVDIFKNLAISQEEAVGDGTTTSLIIAGQLLSNALQLLNKGIHPTTIINGYNLSNIAAVNFLNKVCRKGSKEEIMRTAFGTKIPLDLVTHMVKILLEVKDFEELKLFKMGNSNPLESEVYPGYVFEGFTLNERMKSEGEGNIAILDFQTNIETDKFQVTNSEELEKITKMQKEFKQKIIEKLKQLEVKALFYTDTTPDFESMLTKAGISGIVIHKREDIDQISKALGVTVASSVEDIDFMPGKFKFEKNPNRIYLEGGVKTLIIKGPTNQVLEEIERAVLDVVSLMQHDLDVVTGAGSIEIDLTNHLNDFAQQVGGKEQLAVEKYAEAIESIPLILAENCGLDAIEVLTNLKAIQPTKRNMGVDMIKGISDARERGIVEPALVKIHALNSATNVANLILKLDKILAGDEK